MRESCEGELCLGGLVGRHTLAIECGYQGNHIVQRIGNPPIISGRVPGDIDTVRSKKGKAKFSGLPRGAVGGGGLKEWRTSMASLNRAS